MPMIPLGPKIKEVTDLKSAIENYNCGNLFAFAPNTGATDNKTESGVTFTATGTDGFVIATGTGTASANVIANFYARNSAFPMGLQPGDKFNVTLLDANNSDIELRINKYNPSSSNIYQIKPNVYTEVTIPSDATGLSLYVRVASGKKVNTTVRLLCTKGVMPSVLLTKNVEELKEKDLTLQGLIDANSDEIERITEIVGTDENIFNRTGSNSLPSSVDGLDFEYSDVGHLTFSGTPSATLIRINIWAKNSAFPTWIDKTKDCIFKFIGSGNASAYNVALFYYVSGDASPKSMGYCKNNEAKNISIPSNAVGVAFQLQISVEDITTEISGTVDFFAYAHSMPIYDITREVVKLTDDVIPSIEGQLQSLSIDGDVYRDLYKSIYRIGVIGDSYSAIRLYRREGDDASHPYDSQFYSWFGYLQRESGMSYVNLAASGYECKDWIDGTQSRPELYTTAIQEANLCQLYLICMGINDSGRHDTSYVGTTADINVSDPDQNAASFIGYYAKIIQKLRAIQPKALFIVYTMPTSSGVTGLERYEAYNTGIRAIAEFFDYVYLADLYADYYDMYHTEGLPLKNPDGAFVTAGHYTAEVQPIIAKIMSSEISKIIKNNQAAFCNIEYTGGKKWGPTN